MRQYKSIRKKMAYETEGDRATVFVGLTVAFHSRLAGYLKGIEGYEGKVRETILEICDELLDVYSMHPDEISLERRDKVLGRYSKYLELLEIGEKREVKWDEVTKTHDVVVEEDG